MSKKIIETEILVCDYCGEKIDEGDVIKIDIPDGSSDFVDLLFHGDILTFYDGEDLHSECLFKKIYSNLNLRSYL